MKTRLILLSILIAGIFPATLALAAHSTTVAGSHNWAGYVATSGKYSAVEGSWVVAAPSVSTTASGDGTWVGIGGYTTSDLVQAGTRAHSENGVTSYESWYELFPAPATAIPMSVHAGDTIRVAIRLVASNTWSVRLTDETTGAKFSQTLSYHSSGSSAEWIEEAPGTGGGAIMQLDHFGSVAFTAATAVVSGKAVNLGDLDTTRLSLVDASSTLLAKPSVVAASGATFSVERN